MFPYIYNLNLCPIKIESNDKNHTFILFLFDFVNTIGLINP
jgi:hypothetical protein